MLCAMATSARNEPPHTVWDAEHGSSDPVPGEAEGANAGHRFRIHGRLGREMPEQLRPDAAGGTPVAADQDGEHLREALAQATEIDLADVQIQVGDSEVNVSGTVADDGERRQLEDLIGRLTQGKRMNSRLRPRNP